jgi:hypothetical protein
MGRDIYDLLFLLNKGIAIENDLILEKFKYYGIVSSDKKLLIQKIEKFILDLRSFVPIDQRNRLADFYDYVVESIRQRVV